MEVIHVSVPYRGATFLNESLKIKTKLPYKFPSPIGELHFSIKQRTIERKMQQWFPSPIGELHFSILFMIISGLLSTVDSFRPLSGSYISQSCADDCEAGCKTFPSPIGELHFSMCSKKSGCARGIGFRPLSGSYISQYKYFNPNDKDKKVSVPYRGATFLNH